MKISEKIISEIATANIRQLWNHFVLLEGEYTGWQKDYEKVRFGIKMKFSIFDVWEPNRIFIRTHNVHVYEPDSNVKLSYRREDYRTEIMQREAIMRERLYENVDVKSTLEGR